MSGDLKTEILKRLADDELSRRQFYRALPYLWKAIEPGVEFKPNWIYQAMCEHIQDCQKLIINIPPRVGKSVITVGALPAWQWLSEPEHKFQLVSYSLGLTRSNFAKTRRAIASDWHRQTRLRPFVTTDETKSQLVNDQGGHIQCQALFGSTGHGCNTQIVDDIHSAMDALSDRKRESQIEAFETGLTSRLDNPQTAKRLVIMQRLHPKDLTGHVLAECGDYHHLCIPFEAEEPQTIWLPMSGTTMSRPRGDLLLPDRFTPQWVEEQKRNPVRWYTQYQQKPPEGKGSVWSAEWFNDLEPDEVRTFLTEPDEVLISVEPAGSVEDKSSFWCIGVALVKDGRVYLCEVIRDRYQYPTGKSIVLELYQKWSQLALTTLLIENKSTGVALIPDLRSAGVPKRQIVAFNPKVSKEARALSVTDLAASGSILYNKKATWWANFWLELSTFPRSEHDDQNDMLVQILQHLKKSIPDTLPEQRYKRNAMLR